MTHASSQTNQTEDSRQKSYAPPAIIHAGKLKTFAGSPLGIPNPLDPLNLNSKK